MANEPEMQTSKLHALYITIIVILLVVIAGGFYYLHKQMVLKMSTVVVKTTYPNEGTPAIGAMGMDALTPPPVNNQQSMQLQVGTSSSTTQKTFNLVAGNFYFVPNSVKVHRGDTVTLVMTNAGGVHDLVIDELGVKIPVTHTAQTEVVTFTASKIGSFVYYCTLPGHRAKGMWGTLTVQ